ncbi:acyltransferase domain-containing protein [Citrobacter koseri]|nr:acyltransferase domain-containing protein [Citrobacter koseri]
MAAHWRAEGLKPDFAIGHSVGEFAAAVVCGHYTIRRANAAVRKRRDGGGICRRRHADAAGSPV